MTEVRVATITFAGQLPPAYWLARPDQVYGIGIGSNNQAQGFKLSKHFRS